VWIFLEYIPEVFFMSKNTDLSFFWKNKKVFLTGHTGFKGSWLSLWLSSMGAKVTGYSLTPNTTTNLFEVLKLDGLIYKSHIADICDMTRLQSAMNEAAPDIVLHMAAQPFVRYGYANPIETYATNVMGTVHVLECTRSIETVRATVVVTTDKCYKNHDWVWGYRENDSLGGDDPYSSSKGCAELVTLAYRKSFFSNKFSSNSIATARAGNVIGGGDWANDRLVPDAFRAFQSNKPLIIRNPFSTRPWQHVLDPLFGYLKLGRALYERGASFAEPWNFGPPDEDNYSVQDLVNLIKQKWPGVVRFEVDKSKQQNEANFLKLDCSKARSQLDWSPLWNLENAIQKTVDWQQDFLQNKNMQEVSLNQIEEYSKGKLMCR